MSDCGASAFRYQGIGGRIRWMGDLTPTPLNYARYVDGVERVAESIELDGVLFAPVVRCRDCKWFTPEYFYEEERGYGVKEILSDPPDCGNPERCSHHYDSITGKTVPVHIVTDPDGYCAWGEKMVVE